MIMIIDNYDSFTYNLVQYFKELSELKVQVYRNDEITLEEIEELSPKIIVISPGPGTPREAGISVSVISYFKGSIPILGVCLGHQAIAEVFGGKVVRANKVMHGKVSQVFHTSESIFQDIPSPFVATRYHSLIVDRKSLPNELCVYAETENKEVMAIRHVSFPIEGVQFHPEAILSEYGKQILENFLKEYVT